MPCYSPLKCKMTMQENGKNIIKFPPLGSKGRLYKDRLACGQCVGCRLDRARDWAIRIMHEASLHNKNSFITLTYKDSPGTLIKKDIVDFMKSLRHKLSPKKIRFYMCGEYGERDDDKNQRKKFEHPHYHIIIFGHDFEDKKYWTEENGYQYYRSKTLEKIWNKGYSTIGSVTYESASYTARYLMKKILGNKAEAWYKGVEPEYTNMSRMPGIGRKWIEKFKEDVYKRDELIIKGLARKPPKYYDSIFDLTNPKQLESIKKERNLKALERSKDNTPERLEVRRYIAEQKLKLQKRKLKGF